jgi:hypothetical protein
MRSSTVAKIIRAEEPDIAKALQKIPEGERLDALQDAVHAINGYVPTSLDDGMGRRPTNEAVRAFIATEGHNPKELPDIILGGPDRALVREVDRSCYFKLVKERGSWFCGCGESQCVHKGILKAKLQMRR